MSTNIKTWYDFVMQQMAAESYLDGIGKNGNDLTNGRIKVRIKGDRLDIFSCNAATSVTSPIAPISVAA